MGAFDAELAALGYRTHAKTNSKPSKTTRELNPQIGKQYWTWFKGKRVRVEILSMHKQLGIFRLLEPVKKQYDVGFVEEEYFVIRTQSFYLI